MDLLITLANILAIMFLIGGAVMSIFMLFIIITAVKTMRKVKNRKADTTSPIDGRNPSEGDYPNYPR